MLQAANPATGNTYIEWTASTGKATIDSLIANYANVGIAQGIFTELRLWPAQTPDANTRWASIRWQWQPTTYPDLPFRLEGWRSTSAGDGLTFAAATGTKFTSISIPVSAGKVYKYIGAITGGDIFTMSQYDGEGLLSAAQGVALPFTFASIKTARLYILRGACRTYIDEVILT